MLKPCSPLTRPCNALCCSYVAFTRSAAQLREEEHAALAPASVRSASRRRTSSSSHISGGGDDKGKHRSTMSRARRQQQTKHRRMLETEWTKAAEQSSTLLLREKVVCFWRRPARWDPPAYSATPHPAVITQIHVDGTVDIAFKNGARESLQRVHRRYISRAGELGFPLPGGRKPSYMKSRYEVMRDRWAGGATIQSFSEEMAELRALCDAAKHSAQWDTRHSVTRGTRCVPAPRSLALQYMTCSTPSCWQASTQRCPGISAKPGSRCHGNGMAD